MPASPPAPATAPARVGFLRHTFLARSETFIYGSMRALQDGGRFDISVFGLYRRLPDRFPWPDVTCLRGPGLAGLAETLRYRITRRSRRFDAWARSVRLIHAHLGQTSPFAMAGARRAGIPFCVSYYGHDAVMYKNRERFTESAYWWFTLTRRRTFAAAARVIVLSEDMKRTLVAQGCPEDKLAVVRLGVDLDRFAAPRAEAPADAPLRVLMVGREVDKKGFDDGLRACARAKASGVALSVTLLGTDGPLAPRLRALAAELGLDVHWPDPATPVPQAMAAADVLLVPSRTASDGDQEGTPTVIVEGGAARLALVATRHAGIPEQIDDGATGLLVAERDPEGLAAALAALAADPARRRALGDAACAKMRARYSVAAHRQALEAVYDSILRTTPAPTDQGPP